MDWVGGSSGLHTKATDATMRLLEHVVISLLSHRLGACFVIPHFGGTFLDIKGVERKQIKTFAVWQFSTIHCIRPMEASNPT